MSNRKKQQKNLRQRSYTYCSHWAWSLRAEQWWPLLLLLLLLLQLLSSESLSVRGEKHGSADFFFASFRFVPFYGAFFRVFYLFRVSSDARVCGVRCNYQRTNAVYNWRSKVLNRLHTLIHTTSPTRITIGTKRRSVRSSLGREEDETKMFQLSWFIAISLCVPIFSRRWSREFRFNWNDGDDGGTVSMHSIGRSVRAMRCRKWEIIIIISLMFTITMRDSARLPRK